MAELDYAYLADYAQIENGKISALGASYTHAVVSGFPVLWMTSIVGRIRVAEDTPEATVRIEIAPPGDELTMSFESIIMPGPNTRPYRGKVGLLFAATAQINLPEPGLCAFDIYVDDVHARRLAFEVEAIPAP